MWSILSNLSNLSKIYTICLYRGVFFNKVCRLLVAHFYDEYVKLPETDEDWEAELRGFIGNYGFPCVGAWDGFHVHVNSNLKSNYSFKKKYTVTLRPITKDFYPLLSEVLEALMMHEC